MKYTAIVLAAGQGKRMNAGENKQFIKLLDKPLIIHTLAIFDKDDWCESIVLVANPKEIDRIKELLTEYQLEKQVILVNGGKERQDSVRNGVHNISNKNSIVFIHDGARPFVQQMHLHRLAEVASEKGAALLAVPVTDTIKQKTAATLTTLDRSILWAAQTPQAFQYHVIFKAHERAADDQFIGTDDASLVERLGEKVEVVRGSYDNIKLTTPEDLQRATTYLQNKEGE
ncbi:2-C-methyl-D-erythritol 4-phosphate cytidylyltransferase [Aquibacillus albus]|uniref:2-C-methyl-D-erythritol 4-phosphate cytidylyltransferase n=1 Tax=Aquibacillus albus TaxID=1168171 RepID=UPI001956B5D5